MAIPFIMANTANAQIPEGYEVATWHNFSQAAITYSFDDGTPNQIPVAVPLLDKYGFRGTFNLITSWVKDWNQWKNVAQKGHEIASHTINHPNFGQNIGESAGRGACKIEGHHRNDDWKGMHYNGLPILCDGQRQDCGTLLYFGARL